MGFIIKTIGELEVEGSDKVVEERVEEEVKAGRDLIVVRCQSNPRGVDQRLTRSGSVASVVPNY